MELWIRSQNKEVLAKVSDLYVVIGVECESLENGYDIENRDFRFGRYRTREKALEVLNEIQNYMILPNIENSNYVFQMPKE